jgi:hypothetical protein
MTDAKGRAHTRWTPGSKTGKRTLVAAVKGTDARATFVLEAPEAAAPAKTASVTAKTAAAPGRSAVTPGKTAVKKDNGKRVSP